ncbi:hypothetical protein NtRootD5_27820 [Arthrobacter sp. NtRootD5]|nr:hypothetical protein NtRootA2_27760 [Arthrobacter sp. NtRootA2]BCW28181.1 hypothetical protein NtRootC45_27810 [Arthrobacter sp. NtRootC45]BCW32451.1 hypothetical protein NtRootD5_27820 [Arthrobacter sp. NtRootD5]
MGSDRTDVESWSVSAPGFVESIVFAAYGVSLGQVSLGLAIRRLDLRADFEEAASLIDREEPEEAVSTLVQLFQKAAAEWSSFAGPINGFYSESSSFEAFDKEGYDRLQRQIDRMWGMALYSPLANDPGELAWFLQARKEHFFADRGDAERALKFVFWWLMAFEAAPAQEAVDRRARWHLARRRMRAGNGPAIVEQAGWHSTSQSSGQLTLTIANVPGPESFDIWRDALQALLRVERGRASFHIDESGHAAIDVSDPHRLPNELERCTAALKTAEDVLTAELEKLVSAETEAARVELERERERQAFATAVAELTLPEWIRSIRAEADPRWHPTIHAGNRLVLELTTDGLVGTVASILRDGSIAARRENYSAEELILPFRMDPGEVLAELAPHHEAIQQLIAASRTWGEVPLSILVTKALHSAGIPVKMVAQAP